MKNNNPILIVEDDFDDCEFLQTALRDIGVENEQLCFENGEEALKYLKSTDKKTFLIFSDINMPKLNGLELKEEINKDYKLRTQSIPFIFLSTSAEKNEVSKAYEMMVQGYFKKPTQVDKLKSILKMITEYWDTCQHPNSI